MCLFLSCPGSDNRPFCHRFRQETNPCACFCHVPEAVTPPFATDPSWEKTLMLLPLLICNKNGTREIPKCHGFTYIYSFHPRFRLRPSHLLRFRILYAEGLDSNSLHLLLCNGLVVPVGLSFSNPVDNIHSLSNLAESSVVAVQVR